MSKRKPTRRSKESRASTSTKTKEEVTRKFLSFRSLKVNLEQRPRRRTVMRTRMVRIKTRWSPERSKVWKRCIGRFCSKSKISRRQGLILIRIHKCGNSFMSHMSFSPISGRETKLS
jgi:hypothetical protein